MKQRIFLLSLVALATTALWAGNINKKTFLFGFVTSFNDSVVYFTTIQETDSAWTDKKTKFLYSRDNYSYQLRDYMRSQGVANPTCVTVYALKRKKIEKKYAAMVKRYEKNGYYTIKYVTPTEFTYNTISPDESEKDDYQKVMKKELKKQKKENKKSKKADKKARSTEEKGPKPDGKRPMPDGNRPPQPPRR